MVSWEVWAENEKGIEELNKFDSLSKAKEYYYGLKLEKYISAIILQDGVGLMGFSIEEGVDW